jgi:hypothetical protein
VGAFEAAVQLLADRTAAVVIALKGHPDRVKTIGAWQEIVHALGLQRKELLADVRAPPIYRLPRVLLQKVGESLKTLQLLDETAGEILCAYEKIEKCTARLLREVDEHNIGGALNVMRADSEFYWWHLKQLDEIEGLLDFVTSLMVHRLPSLVVAAPVGGRRRDFATSLMQYRLPSLVVATPVGDEGAGGRRRGRASSHEPVQVDADEPSSPASEASDDSFIDDLYAEPPDYSCHDDLDATIHAREPTDSSDDDTAGAVPPVDDERFVDDLPVDLRVFYHTMITSCPPLITVRNGGRSAPSTQQQLAERTEQLEAETATREPKQAAAAAADDDDDDMPGLVPELVCIECRETALFRSSVRAIAWVPSAMQ